MTSASFLDDPDQIAASARGHVRPLLPTLAFVLPYAVGLGVLLVAMATIGRLWRGRWGIPRRMVGAAAIVAFGLGAVISGLLTQALDLRAFWMLMVACAFVFLAAGAGLAIAVARFLPRPRTWSIAACLLASSVAVATATWLWVPQLPLPREPSGVASAPASLSATAGDIARFLAELSEPTLLSPSLAEQLRQPQVRLASDMSWGLGPGILHGPGGDALWQWGQVVEYQSIMVVYPERGCGVVVCSNSDILYPWIVFDVAKRVVGGPFESIRRAASLEYDHQP
jgi:CubicO group peptidase (beta-lactamase class C family)